jgi:hypothetical protein
MGGGVGDLWASEAGWLAGTVWRARVLQARLRAGPLRKMRMQLCERLNPIFSLLPLCSAPQPHHPLHEEHQQQPSACVWLQRVHRPTANRLVALLPSSALTCPAAQSVQQPCW